MAPATGRQDLHESDSDDRADQQQGNERFGVTRDIQIEIHGVFLSFREVRRPTPMESLVAGARKLRQNSAAFTPRAAYLLGEVSLLAAR